MKKFDFDSLILKTKPLAEEYERVSSRLESPEFSADKTYYLHLLKKHSQLEKIYALYNELTSLDNADKNSAENVEKDDVCARIILELARLGDDAVTSAELTISGDNQCKKAYLNVIFDSLQQNNIPYRTDENSLFATGSGAYALLKEFAGTITIKGAQNGKVTVFVFPENAREKFDENDVEISLFRSDGAGGQNVNKVETGVRATHRPSGITVTCRDERSQLQNKKKAIEALENKYISFCEKEKNAEREKIKNEQRKITKTINL